MGGVRLHASWPAASVPPCSLTAPRSAEHISRVAEAVAGSLQSELSAGDRLRDLLQPRRCDCRRCQAAVAAVGKNRLILATPARLVPQLPA